MKKARKKILTSEKFHPSMDWWVAILFIGLAAVLVASYPVILYQPMPVPLKLFGVIGLTLSLLYILDIAFFTSYYFGKEQLWVVRWFRSIPFSYRLMKDVAPGNIFGLFSFGTRKRFALSGNCLVIRMNEGTWKSITISPKDKQKFINILLQHIENEKSHRAIKIKS